MCYEYGTLLRFHIRPRVVRKPFFNELNKCWKLFVIALSHFLLITFRTNLDGIEGKGNEAMNFHHLDCQRSVNFKIMFCTFTSLERSLAESHLVGLG